MKSILAQQSVLVFVVGGVNWPPYLECDVNSAVGVDVPTVDVSPMDKCVVWMKDVDGVIPVVEVFPGYRIVTKHGGVCKVDRNNT